MAEFETNASEGTLLANILDGNFIEDTLMIISKVTPNDFLDERNRHIYNAVVSLTSKNEKVDDISVIHELTNLKTLNLAGGQEYVQFIKNKFLTSTNITSAINAVLDRSLLNRFIGKLKSITDKSINKPIKDISDFIGESENEILEISKQRRTSQNEKMDAITKKMVAHLASQTEIKKNRDPSIPKYVEGLPTGYEDLDKITLGWQKQDMIVIGARPSVGKTAFALNLAYNVLKKGTPVLFCSLEMGDVKIGFRLLSKSSKLPYADIADLDVKLNATSDNFLIDSHGDNEIEQKAQQIRAGLKDLSNLDLYMYCNTSSSILDIVSNAKKLKTNVPNLGLIIIDYLSFIRSPNNGGKENRSQEVAEISHQLKSLARELDLPVIVLSQLNRETEKGANHKPTMADIRESGNVEQDADIIMMLYREDYYYQNKEKQDDQDVTINPDISTVEVQVLKNRNGPTGELKFSFDKPLSDFVAIKNDNGDDLYK